MKKAYNQLNFCKNKSKKGHFSFVMVKQFFSCFHGIGDMPNEYQWVKDSLLKEILFTSCYMCDILIAVRGTLKEHKAIIWKVLILLDTNAPFNYVPFRYAP